MAEYFQAICQKHSPKTALEIQTTSYSYEQLWFVAGKIQFCLKRLSEDSSPYIAVLAAKSISAYAGILGILAAGKGFVALNPKYPPQRNSSFLTAAQTRTIIIGTEGLATLADLLPLLGEPYTLLFPEPVNLTDLPRQFPEHRFILSDDFPSGSTAPELDEVSPQTAAYLMFTSGSTGTPKGVPITQANILSYLNSFNGLFGFSTQDRFSQVSDLSFDLSVHDMFICWTNGACLVPVPEEQLIAPGRFFKERRISVTLLVPSIGMLMQQMRLLKPGSYPELRQIFFAGESLPVKLAQQFQRAAPNAAITNIYGLTETTITFTHHTWTVTQGQECINGQVPIGRIFPGHCYKICDETGQILPAGKAGELCISGPQVFSGYLDNPGLNKSKFLSLLSENHLSYFRTGDLVIADNNNCLSFLGRTDEQIKIFGHRIELQEIDYLLQKAAGHEMIIAVPWPFIDNVPQGVVAFACHGHPTDARRIFEYCTHFLPKLLVPQRLLLIDKFPLSPHGKIDREQLKRFLAENEPQSPGRQEYH